MSREGGKGGRGREGEGNGRGKDDWCLVFFVVVVLLSLHFYTFLDKNTLCILNHLNLGKN